MSLRTDVRMFERIETPIRMPDEKIWPDCPLCGCDVVRCECDPNAYQAAILSRARQ